MREYLFTTILLNKRSTYKKALMKLYGIKNCDSVKKACKWLEQEGISYDFVDLRQTPPSQSELNRWNETGQGHALINTRSTTFRQLSDSDKALIKEKTNQTALLNLLQKNPTLIKRPVLIFNKENTSHIEIGFNTGRYQMLFTPNY